MKSYVTFRRHPFDAVVARTNEDRHPLEVVPYGRFGAGLWTGHPIGLFIVTGLVVIGGRHPRVAMVLWSHSHSRRPRWLFSLAAATIEEMMPVR